ncbi:HAMP domain-containing protein [Paenibacillus sp. UNC496MF]|uniref:cache domain-containing sensor histidine kinase n=1 Tax=Paenibacillus sp. UNC496MF TaxID=1502753 RepID=UPI0008E2C6F9|nr:histidine kinase [Paenibacillus sp. UNC496MF]SFJ41442.1 HAMP domain-containing protein [Paenibacillus sp. UNC496MF]
MRWLTARVLDPIRSRLFYKMLIIYSLLTLVPLLIVSATFYIRSSLVIEKKAAEEAQRELSGAADKFDEVLYAVKSQMTPIGENLLLQSLLRAASRGQRDDAGYASVDELLQSELTSAKLKIGEFVSGIYVLDAAGQLYSTDSRKRLLYPDAYWKMPFEFDRLPEWAFFSDDRRIACVVKIFAEGERPSPESETGRLVVTLDTALLRPLFAGFAPGKFFIANADNQIMSASDLGRVGHLLDIREPVKGIVIRQKSRYSEFQYVLIASPGTGGLVKQQALFIAGITLAAWLAITIVTYVILRRITIPIQRLTRLMRAAEREEYQLITGIATKDEIAMLCNGFNSLVARTSHLIETNYKNELLLREAELKAIRMYINPHFLYNTMEYISIMSHSPEKAKHIPQMIHHLSGIFRFSITPGNAFVELGTEMEFVRKYLEIHRFRYGDRLTYAIDLPDLFRKIAIPKLLLQPLVENAVVHGIDRLPEGGTIAVTVKEEQYELVIEIANSSRPGEDDGASGNLALRRSKGLGSGLENANARLRLHYGNTYGVSLLRHADDTVTRVVMPIQILQDNEGG